jgi:hypothetical protein
LAWWWIIRSPTTKTNRARASVTVPGPARVGATVVEDVKDADRVMATRRENGDLAMATDRKVAGLGTAKAVVPAIH